MLCKYTVRDEHCYDVSIVVVVDETARFRFNLDQKISLSLSLERIGDHREEIYREKGTRGISRPPRIVQMEIRLNVESVGRRVERVESRQVYFQLGLSLRISYVK